MDDAWGWSLIAGLAMAAFGPLFSYAIQMRAEQRYSAAWFWFMVSPLPLVAWTIAWAIMAAPSDGWRRIIAGLTGLVVGPLVLIGLIELWHGQMHAQAQPQLQSKSPNREPDMPEKTTSSQPTNSLGNFSINQQGGVVNQTYVNHQQPKLNFTQAIGEELLSKVKKNKDLNINLTGNQSDLQIGEDFANFFRANGYKVNYTSIMMMMPPPEHQLTLTELPEASDLVIAPSVR